MRKAILASVILSAIFSVAHAADVKSSGDFGYRYDDLEVGTSNSQNDRLRVNLATTAAVNDKTNIVIGLRTGTVKSSWNDMDGNSMKNVAINLAYVEYAAASFAKVTFGKMNRPWASDALFFDNDIKPEGLAVAVKHDSGLTASAFKLKLAEGGSAKDSDLVGLQVGVKKALVGDLAAAVSVATLQQERVLSPTLVEKFDQLVYNVKVEMPVAGFPVAAFYENLKNDKATSQDKATAYGVTFGNAKKAGDWEVSVLKQDAEAKALSTVWTDSDFGGEAALHNGTAVRAVYALADGWKVRGSLYDVETGTAKTDYKRLMVDLVFAF